MEGPNSIIASLDVGTTTVRCHIINNSGDNVHEASDYVELHCPEPGRVEIEPDHLWKTIVNVVKNAIRGAGLESSDVKCLGISCQRATFITWNKKTGKPYHNFITWQDLRADSLVRDWNNSVTLMALHGGSRCLYTLTRRKRYLAGSVIKFMNAQVTLRLLWVIQHIPEVKNALDKGELMFGTVDSWLLYKLSGGKLHLIEVSCASATGFFDPFTMKWADWALKMFDFKLHMFPEICDSTGEHFGSTVPDIFGHSIPIRAVIADQSASLFGSCCFNEGDAKVTIGTGTFFDVNTGKHPHASVAGLYPVVGWKIKNELVYVAEGLSKDSGTLITWAQRMGFLGPDPSESYKIATSVPGNDGVYFVPAFSGLQAPVNDVHAAAGFVGVKRTSQPAHFLRAILESIAFRILELYYVFVNESNCNCSYIRVDGGVSRNDFVLQLVSDLTGLTVERAKSSEMSVLGAAFLAGLATGIWTDKKELVALRKVDKEFKPRRDTKDSCKKVYSQWKDAVTRFLGWYEPS
ncbi:glycerol kinase 5 [Lycorma delicatula]|uniref:glycerol kinase 5 n=1 Tax=Lycorma delicatula TaxID=130591 RepID=UPI003F512869